MDSGPVARQTAVASNGRATGKLDRIWSGRDGFEVLHQSAQLCLSKHHSKNL
jgi:hypothetical protein